MDRNYVLNAREAWQRVLALQEDRTTSANVLAVSAALWATMHADKLLELADAATRQGPEIGKDSPC